MLPFMFLLGHFFFFHFFMSMKKLQEDANCPKPDPHGAARTDSAAKNLKRLCKIVT